MNALEIIETLQSMRNEKYRENVIRLGIPEACSIGVSTGEIRRLAKTIKKSNELGFALWDSGFHEARLLAVLLFDKKTIDLDAVERMMEDVISWDLCDHMCKNLIIKLKGYPSLIPKWCGSDKTYIKRAAFTLIASALIHDDGICEDEIKTYLKFIQEYSCDPREHVKKAISWALREIGKKDFDCQEKAVLVAYELRESSDVDQVWIGKDALKEIENLVQVEGRSRLINANSKMGKEK